MCNSTIILYAVFKEGVVNLIGLTSVLTISLVSFFKILDKCKIRPKKISLFLMYSCEKGLVVMISSNKLTKKGLIDSLILVC